MKNRCDQIYERKFESKLKFLTYVASYYLESLFNEIFV